MTPPFVSRSSLDKHNVSIRSQHSHSHKGTGYALVDLDLLAFAEVEVVDDALCTTAVRAPRLGEDSNKVFVDGLLNEFLCRGHCWVRCEMRGCGSHGGGEWVGNVVEDGSDGTGEQVHF